MATRVIPPRILKKSVNYYTASKKLLTPSLSSTLSPPPCFLDQKPPSTALLLPRTPTTPDPSPSPSPPSLDLHDVQKLFSFVPTPKLLRSTAVLHATAIEPMVDFGMWLMKSNLMLIDNLRDIVLASIKATFYDNFCAGEDAITAGKSITALKKTGLRGMLVYGVEDAHDNLGCDANLDAFLHTVDVSKSLPPSAKTPEKCLWSRSNRNLTRGIHYLENKVAENHALSV